MTNTPQENAKDPSVSDAEPLTREEVEDSLLQFKDTRETSRKVIEMLDEKIEKLEAYLRKLDNDQA